MNKLIAVVFLLAFGSAQAATVQFIADVWGTVQDTGNTGTFNTVISTEFILIEFRPSPPWTNRGVWEFDLSALPSGNITGVELQTEVVSVTLEQAPASIFGYIGNGVIETTDATAGSLVAILPGDLTQTIFDVTSFILDPAVLAAGFAGFNIRYTDEVGNRKFKQLDLPRLIVEYSVVPVPAAAWLFGSALGLFGLLRRRRIE